MDFRRVLFRSERGAVDVGDAGGLIALLGATERVDQELGAECRSADADVEDRADRPERLRLYRVDEGAHPGVETLSAGDALRRPLPAFGGMLGRAAFGDIDLLPREERLARASQVARLGERLESGDYGAVHMSLRRSAEHTSGLQSLMSISYAVLCLKKKTQNEY